MLVYLPEMEVHASGKDGENHELEIMQHGVVGVLEESRCEYVHH
jgi:hypothetical protein